jgi:hypothetical protein
MPHETAQIGRGRLTVNPLRTLALKAPLLVLIPPHMATVNMMCGVRNRCVAMARSLAPFVRVANHRGHDHRGQHPSRHQQARDCP